jgi:hypothetical protein
MKSGGSDILTSFDVPYNFYCSWGYRLSLEPCLEYQIWGIEVFLFESKMFSSGHLRHMINYLVAVCF